MKSAFLKYLAERFPIPAYTILVGSMVLAATSAAFDGAGQPVSLTWRQLAVFFTLMLGFFHLRVFDEHKDFEKDKVAHPDRILSQGLITLADLRKAGFIAILLQLILAGILGLEAFAWAVAVLIFSVAMRYEFGVGNWLDKHIVIYAISHNPVVALMMCFVTAGALETVGFSTPVVLFILVASFTSIGFEIGRKLRAPEDEKKGQDTYTAALGVGPAVALLALVLVASIGLARVLLQSNSLRIVLDVTALLSVAGVFRFLFKQDAKSAKLAELSSTLVALVIYVLVTVDVIWRNGVMWN